jgi:hypothetical protein
MVCGHRAIALMPCVVASRASNARASLGQLPCIMFFDDSLVGDLADCV